MNEIVPISEDQAKALQEGFKFGSESLQTARAFGSYMASILGTVPEDLVGLLGGDWLRFKRAENLIGIAKKARERLNARQVSDIEPVALALALPLLQGAADEDRDELTDLWARLLAAAMDPNRSRRVRQSIVEAVKRMDPLDAIIVSHLTLPITWGNEVIPERLARELSTTRDEAEVSLLHLCAIGIYREVKTRPGEVPASITQVDYTVFGRELKRLLGD